LATVRRKNRQRVARRGPIFGWDLADLDTPIPRRHATSIDHDAEGLFVLLLASRLLLL
jgi:hypothetical protein